MFYWLCLIVCIQSSYCGLPPLMRSRHELPKSHTNHETDLQNEFEPAHFKSSIKNTRSNTERFPMMKAEFKERASDENSNNISSHRFHIRTPNVKRKSNIKHAHSKKSAIPQIKSFNPNSDSSFTQSSAHVQREVQNLYSATAGIQDPNYEGNQNQVHPSNIDDSQVNKSPDEHVENLQESDDKNPLNVNRRQYPNKYHKKRKSHFPGGKYEHKPVKESNTDNEKREPISYEDSMRKPKIPDGSGTLDSSNQELEANQNSEGGSWFGGSPYQRQTSDAVGNGNFMENFEENNGDLEKPSPNIGGMSKGTKMGIRNHKKSPKKKHGKKHNFKGVDTKSPDKKNIPFFFQPVAEIANKPMFDETSDSESSKDIKNEQYSSFGHLMPPLPEYGSMNLPQTHEVFEQNDILQDQQPSNFVNGQIGNSNNFPIPDERPNTLEIGESPNEIPLEEQSDQLEKSSMQDPLKEKKHFKQNNMQQDRQMNEPSIPQNNLQNSVNDETPMNPDSISDHAGYRQGNEMSTAGESSELYKPILFKLGESSESIRRSVSNDNNTDRQRKAEQVESKNINSGASIRDREAGEIGAIQIRNENQNTPDPFSIYTSNKDTEDSFAQSTTTQQISYFYLPSQHNLKKKSNNFEYYNKYPIDSEENYPYENIEREQVYFPNKRSNKIESDFNMKYQHKDNLYRKREDNVITTTTVEQDTKTSNSLSQKENNPSSTEPFTSESQISDNKIETFTSIIQEYGLPTLGTRNKIMKSFTENQKRSPSQNIKHNFNNLHTDSMHIRNTKHIPVNEQNGIEPRETKVHSDAANQWKINTQLKSKLSRSMAGNNFSTQHPAQIEQVTDKYQPNNEFSPKPNNTSFSKRNEQEGSIVDKVTRTYEGLKTKQTIVKDSLTNKETNVVENQKEKIVDSIHLTKQSESKPSNNDTENQNKNSVGEEQTVDEDSYLSDYEENFENYSEPGISDQTYQQTTEEMYYDADGNFVDKTDVWYSGINNDRPNGKVDISLNQKSNTFKTDAFKTPPDSNKNDYSDSINSKMSQNTAKNNPVPSASNVLQQPMSNAVQQPMPNDQKQPMTNDQKQPIAGVMQQTMKNDLQKPIPNDQQQPMTNDQQQPMTSAMQQPMKNDQQQPMTNDQQSPMTSAMQQPMKNDQQQPMKNDQQQPMTNDQQQPMTNDLQKPMAGVLQQPMTFQSQYSNSPKNFDENEIGKENENLEPPNDDEYSYQDPNDESEFEGQSSFSEFQDNKGVPEQSTDNFIDLEEQEEKKENVLEDLNRFPTAKLNNKPNGYLFMPEPERQKVNQRNFYEFSTILPNANNMGEFQREEKVERQSKVIHKKNGIVTNGTSSLFGEKKIEVKDNRQNYHETYMEEKGESKFPNEQAGDSEKQNRNDNSSEAAVKVRQTPERGFPSQNGEGNSDEFNSNSKLLKPWNRETEENGQSTKDKKSAYYADDDSYNEYDYAKEDNPESMMDPEEKTDEEYDEYVVNPKDVLKNEESIDGISKRSDAFIDISKLEKNGKALRSSELPNDSSQLYVSPNTGISSDLIITTMPTDEQSNMISSSNELSKRNGAELTADTSKEPSAQSYYYSAPDNSSNLSNRQIDTEQIPPLNLSNRETSGLNQNTAESEKLIEHRSEDNAMEISPKSVNSRSGNIVYVTMSSTTDKESKFHDFLQIKEVGRQSRQSQRHPGAVYRRQRKHLPMQRPFSVLTNYRINRSSNYSNRKDNF